MNCSQAEIPNAGKQQAGLRKFDACKERESFPAEPFVTC